MKSIFIPKTNKRYSITEDGIVICNYRYNKNGVKAFVEKEVTAHIHSKYNTSLIVSLQFGRWTPYNKPKSIFLSTLMEKCFKLKKPDKFHFYDLVTKNGDFYDLSLKNLEYKIRVLEASNYNYYPQPFYNLKKKITHKICAKCGLKKDIIHFNLQQPRKKNENRTYRNICESCRSIRQWNYIKSDPKRLERSNLQKKIWIESKEGQKYIKAYRKKYGKDERENLHDHYIASSLRLNIKDLTPQLITLSKSRILLTRSIKTNKK